MTAKWQNILRTTGLVPVVKLAKTEDALPLARALREGGLSVAEITFRTEAAAGAIAAIREKEPSMLVGAGTVLTEGQLHDAISAGAQFIVTPGTNPKIIALAQSADIPVIPGCMTPTEIEAALSMGLTTLKFFPAEAAGGVTMLKALSAPYSMIQFMPTGGITPANLESYLLLPCVLACGGSYMVKENWIAEGDFSRIRTETEKTVALIHRIRTVSV